MGAFLLLAIWILIGLLTTFAFLWILKHEDREQRRERIAREEGHYPPKLTLVRKHDD